MKAEDLRTLDHDELGSRLKGARRELYELRFKIAVGQLDDHRQIRKIRKDIARILTVVHARRLGEEVQEAPVTDFEPDAVEARAAATAVAEAPAVEPDASGRDESEETPENVETASEADQPAPASPKTSRRRRAAGEEGND
ncbi:MAG TPA: 50S ribosomal protein L29 [Myxococcales bacterium]|nr:50S ribosomal protein L29 [Myxococcales bacterium]